MLAVIRIDDDGGKPIGATYTQADYDVWRVHFGQTVGNGSAILSAVLLPTVPEPSILLLTILATSGCCLTLGRAAWKFPRTR
jgi:hypothetical protein